MAIGKKTGGRQLGSRNRFPSAVKQMILGALTAAGGVAYLTRQAIENPGPFLSLLGKILPMQITGENGGAIVIQISPDDAAL